MSGLGPPQIIKSASSTCRSNLRRLVHQEQEGNSISNNNSNSNSTIRLRKRQDSSLPLASANMSIPMSSAAAATAASSTNNNTSTTSSGSGSDPYRQLHNPVWRRMVVEWCYSVIDHIGADRELVYIAIHILDRFLLQESQSPTVTSTGTSTSNVTSTVDYMNDKQAYETAVMTCLLITLKLNGLGDVLQIHDLLQMSSTNQHHAHHHAHTNTSTNTISNNISNNNQHAHAHAHARVVDHSKRQITSRDITTMGRRIVHALTWNKQIPTAARFAHAYVQFLLPDADSDSIPENKATAKSSSSSSTSTTVHTSTTTRAHAATEQLFENAVYQIELALQDEYCASQPPSLLAWMAFENALLDSELDMDMDNNINMRNSNNNDRGPCMSMTSKAKLRSTIAKLTGHKYDLVLRRRLQHYQPPMMSMNMHMNMMKMSMSKSMAARNVNMNVNGIDSEAETDTEEDILLVLPSDKIMVIPTTQEENTYLNDDDGGSSTNNNNKHMSCSNSSNSSSSTTSTTSNSNSRHNETFTVQKDQNQVRNDILRALALRQACKAAARSRSRSSSMSTSTTTGLSRTTKVVSFEDMASVASTIATTKRRNAPVAVSHSHSQPSASSSESQSHSHPVATLRRTKRTKFL
uniref:Cyclin N-terminal domain-containing protein n=1 Tax=Chaetoceros debilis TaxID=122233 RepID=A0A7S3QG48_9STRA